MKALSHYQIDDISLLAYDTAGSQAGQWVAWELQRDDYFIRDMHFDEGDIVIDIGAHIGLFCMYLGKRWPGLKVFAFEPFPENYRNCVENLRINQVANVVLSPKAIVNDRRPLSMATDPHNSGGASALVRTFEDNGIEHDIPLTTLDDVFSLHGIESCKLLKIDCEGMEHEILRGSKVLHRIEYLRGEFHASTYLQSLGLCPERLYEHCQAFFEESKMRIQFKEIPS